MSQPVLIIGSGALACLFAARLARAGAAVAVTGTYEPALTAIRQNGIGLISGDGRDFFPVKVVHPELDRTDYTHAILLNKAYQTTSALKRVKPWLSEDCPVLSLQNGLTPRMRMVEILGESRTISGTTTCAAELLKPGIVRHNGGESVLLGRHSESEFFRILLSDAGFHVSVVDDLRWMTWEKAIINSAANPVGAILRMRNGEMAGLPEIMALMDMLISEACAVAEADGCPVDAERMQDRLREILATSSNNRCSMLQDVLHGRQTEINDINGAILELAEKYRIQTPVQRTVTQLVRYLWKEEP